MKLRTPDDDASWWIAEIDIRPRVAGEQSILPAGCAGGVAWVAAWGRDEANVVAGMAAVLAGEGLELAGVETLKPIAEIADAARYSRQVAANLSSGEDLGTLVWGDIFPYRSEGKA